MKEQEACRILLEGGEGEIVEKKSRFIATVRKVESESEAVAFIEEMKKKYWDARHNCSAFVIGRRAELTRCSDDGEPSGTAGRPMLEVLLGEGVRNVAVVVTRYFGGTLLGTGGLVRAYTQAVKEGLVEIFINSGCAVSTPTCGPCLGGHMGVLADKEYDKMIGLLRPFASRFVCVTPKNDRALPAGTFAGWLRGLGCEAEAADSVAEGVRRAAKLAGAGPVVACGSLYMAAEIRMAAAEL